MTGLQLPVDIQNAGDDSGRLFVVEQTGRILVLKRGVLANQPFLDIRSKVLNGGERGLLGLAFPPQFSKKQYFYVNYTEGRGAPDLRTVIARYRVSAGDPNVADSASEERILVVNQPFDNHNGGQLAFSPVDGFLYIGLGDGGSANDPQNNSQNTNSLLGKMLRIDVESGLQPYSVPASNPFVGRAGYRSEIWATGLRNPWRYSFDRQTGDLWIGDVGQGSFEEVDFQPAGSSGGENYGWKIMEGSQCVQLGCASQQFTPPILAYPRSFGFSVTGGFVYRGTVNPHWAGTYFMADFGSGRFWGIRRNGSTFLNSQVLHRDGWNISAFGEDEDGEIYFARYANPGTVYRLADETPATRNDMIMNHASGELGITPAGRVVVAGWGVSDQPGRTFANGLANDSLGGFRVFFDDLPGRIAEVFNIGGQEALVVVAPDSFAGRESTRVVVERDGKRSQPVESRVHRVQPGLYWGVVPAAPAGSEITLLGTGFGATTSDGACALAVELLVGDAKAQVLSCRTSRDYAGVIELLAKLPDGLTGEQSLRARVDGVTGAPITITVR